MLLAYTNLAMLLYGLLTAAGCSESSFENHTRDEDPLVVMLANGAREFRLSIPRNYLRGKPTNSRIGIRVLYPAMVGFTPDLRDDFFTKAGARNVHYLKISLLLFEPETRDVFVYKNKNDYGRFLYENSILRESYFSKTTRIETDPVSPNIEIYLNTLGKEHRYYVINDGAHLTVAWCPFNTICRAQTSIHRDIGVVFEFNRELVSEFGRVDEAVRKLLQSFIEAGANAA